MIGKVTRSSICVMNKRTIALIAVLIAISAAYDFYRGYQHTRSIVEGIIVAVFGLLFLRC